MNKMHSASKRFLLVGSPNSGKTTLFNALTGLHQKTANYPGVTIEKFVGITHHQNVDFEIIDLPGIYSLYPNSIDEHLTVNEILNFEYDGLVLVANADQFQKNLLLTLQVLDLKKPCVLVLNMIDEVRKKNIEIQVNPLSELLDVQIVLTNARRGEGVDELKNKLLNLQTSKANFNEQNFIHHLNSQYNNIQNYENWLAFYLNNFNKNDRLPYSVQQDLNYKNTLIRYISDKSIKKQNFINTNKNTIDKILTHRYYGFIFLILVLLMVFQLVFFIAEYPMEWIEWAMNNIAEKVNTILPPSEWAQLIVNGVIPGITGIIMFIPQITLLFLMIGILEESGYMSRVSFLMDSIFKKFGLSGKSLIPLVSGVACAVPSILSARTITNIKEKMITILVLPFMSCSARLPVYTLLISLIFPENQYFAFFNIKGLVLLGLYLLGFTMALLYAFLFQKILKQNQKTFFFIELPSYKIPFWKNLVINVWNKVKIFITDAGKIIFAISIILWYLSTHTFPSVQEKLNQKYSQKDFNSDVEKSYQKELLENSYIGLIGKKIEPVIRPLGYDWKIGIALISAFAAREVFVGTMATLYSSASNDDIISLREKIKSARHTDSTPVFTTATNISLLIYYALAMQCISTMVIVYRELQSIKWMLIQFFMMTGTAYLLAFLAYQMFNS